MIDSIFQQILLYIPLVVGAYISLSLMKVPDLTLESSFLFGAVLSAIMPDESIAMIFASLVGGALVGATVSLLNQIGNIPYLLAAILTNGLFHGISQFCLGKAMVSLNADGHSDIFILCSVSVFVLVITHFLLKSHLGYAFAIYGNNPSFLKQHAFSHRSIVIVGIVIANALSGLSGYCFSLSNGFVDVTIGIGSVLLCITALILGKTLLQTKKPTVLCPLAGIFAYFVLQDFLVRTGFSLKYFNAFQALLVLGTLFLLRKKRQMSPLIDHLGV